MMYLLISLILLSSSVLCSPVAVDWENCYVDKTCFVLRKCMAATGNLNQIDKFEQSSTESLNKDCEVIMTMKGFNVGKTLFMIQLQGISLQTKKVELYHGDDKFLSCEEKDGLVVVEATDSTLKLNPQLYDDYEEVSHFGSTETLCVFTITNANKISDLKTDSTTSIRYDGVKYDYKIPGLDMLFAPNIRIKCDPDSIQDVSEKHGFYVLPVRYKARRSLDCLSYKRDLGIPYHYQLHIQQGEDESIVASELKCVDKQYKFNNGTNEVEPSSGFSAFCALPMRDCTKPPLNCNELCPQFTPADNNKDAQLNCTNGRWIIDGQHYEDIRPICKANSENKPAFVMVYPDGNELELKEGECFDKYDCLETSKLIINKCEGKTCGEVEMGEDKMYIKCKDAEDDLILHSEAGALNGTKEFTCNPDNGLYYAKKSDSSIITVPISSRPVCQKKPTEKTEPLSKGAVAGYSIGAGLVIIVIVLAISSTCFLAVWKRNKLKRKLQRTDQGWKRMSSGERIAKAQEIFGKASVVKPGDAVALIDALQLLDAILECETEDPQVLAAIDPFLRRFQGVAFSKCPPIERLFNRYCYLQAKKIIDKHGWLSEKMITNSNPSGFIRVYAIRLLALARRDDVDAQKMILEGFKKLEFNGLDQYPHCGLLWSLLTQQRVGSIPLQHKFIQKMKEFANDRTRKEVPPEDQIAPLGSIQNQFCYALGTADVCDATQLGAVDALSKVKILKSLSKSVLEGIANCTSGNTSYTLFGPFEVGTGKMLERDKAIFQLLFPSRLELEQMMTAMVFQRKIGDAKTLERRFDAIEREPPQLVEGKEGIYKQKACVKMPEHSTHQVYEKVRECYRLFVASFNDETKDILTWLTEKVEKLEKGAGEGEKKEKEAEKTLSRSSSQSNPIQEKINSNGMKSEVEEKTAVDDVFFVDEFVNSFYKEWNVKRMTACPLNETEQNKYRDILAMLLSMDTVYGKRAYVDAVDVVDICNKAIEVFRTEPVCIEDVVVGPEGISIVADLHGQLYDLARLFDANSKDGKPGYECTKYLFTGDYVDRGDMSLEVIMTLYILKILYPDRFWLLRGNHEFYAQNWGYGFMDEIESRYFETAAEYLYNKLNESFMYMSMCAIVGGQIFCAHGAISPGTFNRHELRLIRKPIARTNCDMLLQDIAWSDPALAVQGYFFNFIRGSASFIGEDAIRSALDRIDCKALIRGHTVIKKGYQIVSPKCLSLFGATAQDQSQNDAAFVRIAEDFSWQIVVLKIDLERDAEEAKFYGPKEVDQPTVFSPTGSIPGEEQDPDLAIPEDMGPGEIINFVAS